MLDQSHITNYFLGQLSTEEADRVEQECFNDNAFAELVFVIEEDLIDLYVQDELTRDERELFDQFYLTTEARRSRVDLARVLNQRSASVPETKRNQQKENVGRDFRNIFGLTFGRIPRYALATVLLASTVLVVWLLVRNSNRELITRINQPINLASPEITPTPAQSPQPSASPSSQNLTSPGATPPPQVATAVFTLYAGTLRDTRAGEQVIRIPPQTENIDLLLTLREPSQQSYNIRIETAEGEIVLERKDVRSSAGNQNQILSIRAPSSRFVARDYVARVFDKEGEAAASYTFRVTK